MHIVLESMPFSLPQISVLVSTDISPYTSRVFRSASELCIHTQPEKYKASEIKVKNILCCWIPEKHGDNDFNTQRYSSCAEESCAIEIHLPAKD